MISILTDASPPSVQFHVLFGPDNLQCFISIHSLSVASACFCWSCSSSLTCCLLLRFDGGQINNNILTTCPGQMQQWRGRHRPLRFTADSLPSRRECLIC